MREELYRYIGQEDFVNLVVNNKDRFVRPISWDDKYEGFIFLYMEKEEDVRRIIEVMNNRICPQNYNSIIDNYFKMWHSKWFIYAQCWSKYPETDAMWRCYSYGNRAIRIRTKKDKLMRHAKKIFQKKIIMRFI